MTIFVSVWLIPGLKPAYLSDSSFVVYRVNWIRARSRTDRWREECILVQSEMQWLANFLRFKARGIEDWMKETSTPGHAAYARKTKQMWLRFVAYSEELFQVAPRQLTAEGVEIEADTTPTLTALKCTKAYASPSKSKSSSARNVFLSPLTGSPASTKGDAKGKQG